MVNLFLFFLTQDLFRIEGSRFNGKVSFRKILNRIDTEVENKMAAKWRSATLVPVHD